MDDAGTRKLAPAFDVCHAYRPGCMWVSQQSLSVNGKRIDITPDDLLHVTKMMSIKKAEQIMKQINGVVNHWPKYAQQVKVNKDLLAAIGKTLLNFKWEIGLRPSHSWLVWTYLVKWLIRWERQKKKIVFADWVVFHSNVCSGQEHDYSPEPYRPRCTAVYFSFVESTKVSGVTALSVDDTGPYDCTDATGGERPWPNRFGIDNLWQSSILLLSAAHSAHSYQCPARKLPDAGCRSPGVIWLYTFCLCTAGVMVESGDAVHRICDRCGNIICIL